MSPIVARAMGVPMLGRIRDVRRMISEGDYVLLDGNEGDRLRPADRLDRGASRPSSPRPRSSAPNSPPSSRCRRSPRDGERHHRGDQCRPARRRRGAGDLTGADGIGLFRTEFQFLVSATLPRREAPAAALQGGARCRRRQAGRLPHRRHRRRQGAALSALRPAARRRIRRWAGARCACRSTAAR